MPLYRRIETAEDIEAVRGQVESYQVDFKARAKLRTEKMAKEVAAFANAYGGTLVVGVNDKRVMAPMTEEEAADAERRYLDAAKDWCRPQPLVHAKRIAVDGGGFCVAINVDPMPGQLVATAAAGDKDGKKAKPPAWRFWMRVGDSCEPIAPEVIPSFYDARIRRLVISVQRMIDDPDARMWVQARVSGGEHWRSWRFEGASLVLDSNAVEVEALQLGEKPRPLSIPLDDILTVWKSAAGDADHWYIRVAAYLKSEGSAIRYRPIS